MSAALQLPPTPEDFERVELVLRSLKAIKAATYDVVLLAFGGFPPQAQQHTSNCGACTGLALDRELGWKIVHVVGMSEVRCVSLVVLRLL